MNLLSSATIFSFFTLISRILGYLRDILIAFFLGASIFADAFFVAFRIPNTFRRLFSEGTFNAAFVPIYSSEMVRSKKNAEDFSNDIFKFLLLGLLLITLIIELMKKMNLLTMQMLVMILNINIHGALMSWKEWQVELIMT